MPSRPEEITLATGQIMWLIDGILYPEPSALRVRSNPTPQVDKASENETLAGNMPCPVCEGQGSLFNPELWCDEICDRCHGERWVTTAAWNARFRNDTAWQDAIERLDRQMRLHQRQHNPSLDDDDDNWWMVEDEGDWFEHLPSVSGLEDEDLNPWADDDRGLD